MKIRLTKAAEEDLIAIFLESATLFGEAQAEKYYRGLAKAFGSIALNPEMARERKELSPPMRILPHGSHLIVYRVEIDAILIVRIRHGREDWQSDIA